MKKKADGKKRSIWKTIIIIFAVFLAVVFVAGIFLGNYFYNLALNPGSDKSAITESYDYDAEEDSKETSSEGDEWLQSVDMEDLYIESFDGLTLYASLINHSSDKWAIVAHGYLGSVEKMSEEAMNLYNLGYNILLPDARGHGGSEGDYVGMGWHERLDYLEWINLIIDERDSDAQIIIYGQSMGAATAMMVSGEDLPDNVKAIVEDCGFTSLNDLLSYQMEVIFSLPSFPLLNFASLVTQIRAGYWIGDVSPIQQINLSETPIMFIHGSEDTFIPTEMVYELYDVASVEKELYIVQGAGHTKSAEVAGEEYWEKVDSFVSQFVSG